MKARAALAIALAGPVLAPVLASGLGMIPAVTAAAVLAAIGIALYPER